MCWIHTDYSTIFVNRDLELPIWEGFDYIASISNDCTRAFVKTFPELKDKILLIENILSPLFVRKQADLEDVSAEMPNKTGVTKILSIGRFSTPKRFEAIPYYCSIMEKMRLNFKWYIVGYGDDSKIQAALEKYNMQHRIILLGKK